MGKKTRLCPAMGREITAAECGEGRHSRIACTAECPFNPFSPTNYEHYHELEMQADVKLFRWTLDNCAKPDVLKSKLDKLTKGIDTLAFYYILSVTNFEKNAQGEIPIQKWIKSGCPGLKNDERTIIKAKEQTEAALLEVRQIHPNLILVEVVDLLNPARGPFWIADKSFALQAQRFATYLCLCHALPHYVRLAGILCNFPECEPLVAEETLQELVTHLGGPTEAQLVKQWLAHNMERVTNAIEAVAMARQKAMLDQLDAQYAKVYYEPTQLFEDCLTHLDTMPDLDKESPSEADKKEGVITERVLFAAKGDPEQEFTKDSAILGRILISPSQWRLEVSGGERLQRVRARLETHMGDRIKFTAERIDDMGQQLKGKLEPFDASLVPPRLVENTQKIVLTTSRVPISKTGSAKQAMDDYLNDHSYSFLMDYPVPALDGKKPREAALDPVLRPKLIRLMKGHIQHDDLRCLENGTVSGINRIVEELGLTEILFPPPPPRPNSPLRRTKSNEARHEDEVFDEAATVVPPPLLPSRPWNDDEVEQIMERAIKTFSKLSEVVTYVRHSGSYLFDVVHEDMRTLLTESDIQFSLPFLGIIQLCYVPKGTNPPEIYEKEVIREFARLIMPSVQGQYNPDEKLTQRLIEQCRQPQFAFKMVMFFINLYEMAPSKEKPENKKSAYIVVLIIAVINVVENAMREYQNGKG